MPDSIVFLVALGSRSEFTDNVKRLTSRHPDCRQTGNNPFHPSRGPLAAILPLFPRRFHLPIPLGLNLQLMPGEHVLGRDVADGAVQTDTSSAV